MPLGQVGARPQHDTVAQVDEDRVTARERAEGTRRVQGTGKRIEMQATPLQE